MSDPTYSPELAGDPNDDDAMVIDSLVTSYAGTTDPMATGEIVVNHLDQRPKRTTRLFTGYQVIDSNLAGVAFLLLPADANRNSLNVTVSGATTTDYVLVADEPSKLGYASNSGQAARIYTGRTASGLESHTGSVYVLGPVGNAAPVVVSWWSVTE